MVVGNDEKLNQAGVLKRFFEPDDERPEFFWENFEDVIYHDTLYGDRRLDDSPELAAFMLRVWTFNRASTSEINRLICSPWAEKGGPSRRAVLARLTISHDAMSAILL